MHLSLDTSLGPNQFCAKCLLLYTDGSLNMCSYTIREKSSLIKAQMEWSTPVASVEMERSVRRKNPETLTVGKI